MKNQRVTTLLATLACAIAAWSLPAAGQAPAGFYGGVAMKDPGVPVSGVVMGAYALPHSFAAPVLEEVASKQRVFGGYRWRNDLAIEAAFARSESYALRPFGTGMPGGVGLKLGGNAETSTRAAWNLDVVGSYTFLRSVALYGRVGYAQSELATPLTGRLLEGEARRTREGVNYGLGLRYDLSRAFGVNLEYTRFGRFAFESFSTTLPETDQVRLGVQFRF